MDDRQSIPVTPQTRLFVANLVIQPLMTVLFGWLAVAAEGWGKRLFVGVLALFTAGLFAFSALVVWRTRGRTFTIEISPHDVSIPQPVAGTTTAIPWASITRVTLHETATVATSFWAMNIHHADDDGERVTTVSSQLIGTGAFAQLRGTLQARGLLER